MVMRGVDLVDSSVLPFDTVFFIVSVAAVCTIICLFSRAGCMFSCLPFS